MFNNTYKNKSVLITGHTGFKGTWLTLWLLKLGANVSGYSDRIPTEPSLFKDAEVSKEIKHFIGDIRDIKRLESCVSQVKPDIIFHLAAQPLVRESYLNPVETFEVNVCGTLNVLEIIRRSNGSIAAGVFITSDKAYENVEWLFGYREIDKLGGEDPYSGSKGAAELVINSYQQSFFVDSGSNVVSVRAGNVIGGGDWAADRIIPDIIRSWSKDDEVVIRNPKSTRPWQHVLEPLSGYLMLGASILTQDEFKNQAFNFGPDSNVNKSVVELLNEMGKYWTKSNNWIVQPDYSVAKEANLLKLNCDKANIKLKWYPTLDFHETIEFTSSWYQNHFYGDQTDREKTFEQIELYCKRAKLKSLEWIL